MWHRTALPNPEGIARLLNRIHLRLFVLVLVPALLAPGRSASFSLKPDSVTIDAHARVAEFEFSSLSARPTVFEVEIEAGKKFIVVPSVFLVAPHATQTFRIALRTFALPRERRELQSLRGRSRSRCGDATALRAPVHGDARPLIGLAEAVKYAIALLWAVWLCAAPALAVETVEDTFTNKYHIEHYRVVINDVVFSTDASVYLSDEEIVYVSDTDLDAWTLKRPRDATFERDGHRYYGLQTDLNLAASFNSMTIRSRSSRRVRPFSASLTIRNGFRRRRPDAAPFSTTISTRQTRAYDFYAVSQGGIYQLKYQSTTSTEFRFYRSLLRWFQLDSATHRAISIGDGNTNGGWIGSSIPFAGVRYASDYTSDPTYVSRGAPSVSGFATAPSLLEVYINNVLQIQRYVPEGPFTVDGLPTSAANSDVVMVLTDQKGVKTTQEARPLYNPTFLGRGFSEFRIDSGIATQNVNQPTQYYRGFVTQADVRYGLTDTISAVVLGETINSKNFADVGADFLLAKDNTFGFRRRHR